MQTISGSFDDIDAMAASPIAWDQEYQQIGRGRFRGELTQLVVNAVHLGRVSWSPGILQRGPAPADSWVFALPIKAEGSLHVRRRPVRNGELITATSRDDIGFAANGATELMVVVLPTPTIDRWMQARRGTDRLDVNLPSPHFSVSAQDMKRRAASLSQLLQTLLIRADDVTPAALSQVESQISDAILDMIPSAEKVEALHSRARIARAVMELLQSRLDNPPTLTELCEAVGARERTLFLSCVEAFGLPPVKLLAELRLNAVHRALLKSRKEKTVTSVAMSYGFTHFSRFAELYLRKFGELPSATLANAKASS